MAKCYLNNQSLPGFKDRIAELTSESKGEWGKLDVLGMMRHLRNVMETAVGDVSYPDESKPIVSNLTFFFATQIMTKWPKGGIKAPEFWTPAAEEDFEKERELWLASLDKFVAEVDKDPTRTTLNPFFGPKSLKQWSLLNGIHMNHHLSQFGV